MLRKTAAIAVLILVITSFTLGSTGRIQTVSGADNDKDTVSFIKAERGFAGMPSTAAATGGERMLHIAGEAGKAVLSQSMPDPVPDFSTGVAFVTVAEGQVTSGIVQEGMPLPAMDGNYSTLVLYTDDLRLEQPMLSGYMLTESYNWTPRDDLIAIPVRMPERPDFDNITINGKLGMAKPDGSEPQFFDFQWRKDRTAGENGTFARFTGHVSIDEKNFTVGRMMLPPGAMFDPVAGVIEINSNLTVDMDKLKTVAASKQANGTNDTYNNHITAGQTNWHVASVSEAVKSLNVDLKWSDPDGKLRLMVYTPDGKVLGPYYDDSDGKTDGRINLNIANPSGVATGEWHLKVTDEDNLGTDDYYVKTY